MRGDGTGRASVIGIKKTFPRLLQTELHARLRAALSHVALLNFRLSNSRAEELNYGLKRFQSIPSLRTL